MEEWLKGYVFTILGVSVAALITDCLIPQGTIRRFARFGTAVILSVVILTPFLSFPELTEEWKLSSDASFEPDYTDAVTRTVHAVPGYENALVFVEQEEGRIVSITVRSDKTLLQEAASALTQPYLTQTLAALFGTDRVLLEEK